LLGDVIRERVRVEGFFRRLRSRKGWRRTRGLYLRDLGLGSLFLSCCDRGRRPID
jgi:hypothetical protein